MSQPVSTRTQKFPGRYADLTLIAAFVRQAAAEVPLDDFSIYMVETAIDEACTNIIEHAYGGENRGDIEVTVQVYPNQLAVTLHDTGKPFDPGSIPDPDIHANLEDQPGHGLGLFFIRKWMDDVRFDFSPQRGNTLTMVKRKKQEKKA